MKNFILPIIILSSAVFAADTNKYLITIDYKSTDHKKQVLAEYLVQKGIFENPHRMFGTYGDPIAWTLTEREFDRAESALEKRLEEERDEQERDEEYNKIIGIGSSDTDKLILLQCIMKNDDLYKKPGQIFGQQKGRRVSWVITDEEYEETRDFLNQESEDEDGKAE